MGPGVEIIIFHVFVKLPCNCITHVTMIKNLHVLTYSVTYLFTYYLVFNVVRLKRTMWSPMCYVPVFCEIKSFETQRVAF